MARVFLEYVLRLKLGTLNGCDRASDCINGHLVLTCLCSIYGIDIQEDNVAICRARLLRIEAEYAVKHMKERRIVTAMVRRARRIIESNIIVGDFLKPETVTVRQWNYHDHRFARHKIGNITSKQWTLSANFQNR